MGASCIGDVCKKFCKVDSDCGGPGAMCVQVNYNDGGVTKPVPGMKICYDHCQPWIATSCKGGLTCQVIGEEKPGTSVCTKGNTSTTSCYAPDYLCAPGYTCVGPAAGPYNCRKLCRIGYSAADCPGVTNCSGLS
ncbi:MAG: hypothetical protein FWD57_00530, partial [Polyangiaceae bacterium]|nr:hypothetical protein [Polyangiaceae bacterium]